MTGKPKKPAGKAGGKAAAKPAPATKTARTKAASGPVFPPGLAGTLRLDEPLGRHTTFRIGGPARWHFAPTTPEAVAEALAWAKREGVPWLVLGLGSNVLIRDGGFAGLVLKIGKGLDQLTHRGTTWKVGAGLPTPLLARRTAEAGFTGVQRLVGVPGTVGGGVFMNAGCHGQDVATVLLSATVITPAGEVTDLPRNRVPFTYRHSGLEGNVVLGCALRLDEERAETIKADLQLYLRKRKEGTPFDQPCCGSVFKNPEGATAGRLIDRCGLKGRKVGGAKISEMHANYIVNTGHASADDVLKLVDIARTAVFKEYGVELTLEVKILGEVK